MRISVMVRIIFQSTHPVRGGTCQNWEDEYDIHISIHPPREGWDDQFIADFYFACISIHPPREGWDQPEEIGRAHV